MPKMTRAQAKRRLIEAKGKVKKVYTSMWFTGIQAPVTTGDMAAIEKILDKCLKRLG